MYRLSSLLAILCYLLKSSESARILAVFPTAAISHQSVFRALTIELSNRGHELFIFTPNPVNNSSLKNYKEIDMHQLHTFSINNVEKREKSWIKHWFKICEQYSDTILGHPEMQRIIAPNSTEHFDLILMEYLSFEAIFAIQNRLKIPMIGVVSLPLAPLTNYKIGNPHALAYSPGILDPYTDDMDFWQRLRNVYRYISHIIDYEIHHLPRQDKLVEKYFGNDMPHVSNLGTEVSLILANSNPVLGYPRPNILGVIEIGGVHLKIKKTGLEKELKNFLDSATDGFIYFSLGSSAKCEQLPAEKINTLISTFASLPYKVLWKWEQDVLPEKPENVFISKWLPQHDILAHPNIKVFVYQGGLQSTEEAITFGVPLVGIPLFSDQEFNVRKIASVQAGLRIDFNLFSSDELKEAILEVMTNESYKENVLKLRDLYNDRQNNPMETAMWWIEYVIRHDGAPHLRPRVRHMAWYQRELFDIFIFILFISSLLFYITYKIIWFLIAKYVITTSVKIKTN